MYVRTYRNVAAAFGGSHSIHLWGANKVVGGLTILNSYKKQKSEKRNYKKLCFLFIFFCCMLQVAVAIVKIAEVDDEDLRAKLCVRLTSCYHWAYFINF